MADLYRLGIASALGLALAVFGAYAPAWALTFGLGIVAGLGLAVLVPDLDPVLRGAWGRLAGALRAITPLRNITQGRKSTGEASRRPPPSYNQAAPVAGSREKVWPKPPNFARLVRGFFSAMELLWRWKWAVLACVVFFWASAALTSCTPWGKSKGEIARERDQARADLEAEREMTRVIVPIIGQWRETRARIETAHETALDAIEVPRGTSETDFLLAWARADRGLLDAASLPA